VVGAESAENKPGVLLHDSTGLVVVPQSGRLIATLGLHDVVVVDTPDAVLVCPRDRAQDIKQIVSRLADEFR
jgi:mannose-1-phosphate guanylyltransferase